MVIAFFSYEFPVETGGGGIGTYLQFVSKMLRSSGHFVTVFTGTNKQTAFWEDQIVYRIPAKDWQQFNEVLPDYFLPLHIVVPFDVAECTDFCACGLSIKKIVPELPIVVRLHTPLYMVDRLLYNPLSFSQKWRFIAGSLIKGQLPRLPKRPATNGYVNEFELIRLAERVCSPSESIYREMSALGFQLDNKTDFVPLPFITSKKIKEIKARTTIKESPQIVFIGRLEKRKGVIDLSRAIPKVLKLHQGAHFTFVGESALSPVPGVDMLTYLKKVLKRNLGSVTFSGKLPHSDILHYLKAGDIFVFPSYYESFGLACCEAMAAGKAVVGSENGGMSEIIENGKSGILVSPKHASLLADTICMLIEDNALRLSLGTTARQRIESFLNVEKISALQVASYQYAIDQSKKVEAL